MKKMYGLMMLVSFSLSCAKEGAPSSVKNLGISKGQFKGFASIHRNLIEATGEGIDFSKQFEELLGTFQQGEFVGGIPNPVNSFIWDLSMQKVARREGVCEEGNASEGTLPFPQSAKIYRKVCLESTLSRDTAYELWNQYLFYEADGEFELWYSEVKNLNLAPQDRLTFLIYSILMNPYFLLEH